MTTRRDFLKTGAAAGLCSGLVGGALAADVEDVIREVKFIDIHAHATEYPIPAFGPKVSRYLPVAEEVLSWYDRLGVEKGVLLALSGAEGYVGGMSTEQVLRLAAAHPDRFIPAVANDPRNFDDPISVPFAEMFRHYRARGCRVVGEVIAHLHLLDPRVQNYLKGAEDAGLPVTFHIAPSEGWKYGVIDEAGLPELETCLQRFPRLKVLGHSQGFWCEMSVYPRESWDARNQLPKGTPVVEGRVAELMRRYPNLYCDLSAGSGYWALARDPGYAAGFLTEFSDRVMFGLDICAPDCPVPPLPDFLRGLFRSGAISEAVFRKVARENQIRLLGLEEKT